MKLIRYTNPLSESFGNFDHWFRNPMESFGRIFDLANQMDRYSSNRGLAFDLYEDDDHFYARVEVPGVKKKDLSLELNDGTLTIGFEREAKSGESEENTAWKRSITVPDGVDPEKVVAKLDDGILTVTLPKSEAPETAQDFGEIVTGCAHPRIKKTNHH